MKTILFPTDFSIQADQAFSYALKLAEVFGAEIDLLHVLSHEIPASPYPIPPVSDPLQIDRVQDAMVYAENYQTQLQDQLGLKIPVNVILEEGTAASEINRLSKDHDLVIMGTQGATHAAESALGSVAASVIRSAQCPVMVIPKEARFEGIQHLLYATTLQEEDWDQLPFLMDWADKFDAKLSFAHVNVIDESKEKFAMASVERPYVYRNKTHQVSWNSFTHSNVQEGLQTFIEVEGVDLVAILTHQRDLIARLFEKSQAQALALHSTIPVLVFHA